LSKASNSPLASVSDVSVASDQDFQLRPAANHVIRQSRSWQENDGASPSATSSLSPKVTFSMGHELTTLNQTQLMRRSQSDSPSRSHPLDRRTPDSGLGVSSSPSQPESNIPWMTDEKIKPPTNKPRSNYRRGMFELSLNNNTVFTL